MLKRFAAPRPSSRRSPRSSVGAASRRDPRAGAGEGERRHRHQDRFRAAAGASSCGSVPSSQNVTADSPELQKAVAESTPELILEAVDELLLVQRGRELGYAMSDEQFKSVLENIKKDNNIEDEAKFQEALKQEGHDAGRPAAPAREEHARDARAAERGARQDQRHRRRGARLLRRAHGTNSRRRPSSRCARS